MSLCTFYSNHTLNLALSRLALSQIYEHNVLMNSVTYSKNHMVFFKMRFQKSFGNFFICNGYGQIEYYKSSFRNFLATPIIVRELLYINTTFNIPMTINTTDDVVMKNIQFVSCHSSIEGIPGGLYIIAKSHGLLLDQVVFYRCTAIGHYGALGAFCSRCNLIFTCFCDCNPGFKCFDSACRMDTMDYCNAKSTSICYCNKNGYYTNAWTAQLLGSVVDVKGLNISHNRVILLCSGIKISVLRNLTMSNCQFYNNSAKSDRVVITEGSQNVLRISYLNLLKCSGLSGIRVGADISSIIESCLFYQNNIRYIVDSTSQRISITMINCKTDSNKTQFIGQIRMIICTFNDSISALTYDSFYWSTCDPALMFHSQSLNDIDLMNPLSKFMAFFLGIVSIILTLLLIMLRYIIKSPLIVDSDDLYVLNSNKLL